jgi:hypothetical protein
MGITRLRANAQIKSDTVSASQIKNYSILPEDLAPNLFTGIIFSDGSIPFTKLDTSAKLELSAGVSVSPFIDMAAVAAQATPALGYGRLYVKEDKHLHFINDDGDDVSIDTAGLTYIPEYNAFSVAA